MDEDVRRRAVLHAALGEPVRLAITDRLALGDASPGELGTELGVPTNLLAHHLNTLQEAGLVRRIRSEGDRRRSYVQLVFDDPLVAHLITPEPREPAADGQQPVRRVLFVCTHNSARSQLAAATWSQVSTVPVASAGTHPAPRVHPRAIRIGRRHGLRLDRGATAHLDQVTRPGDLVVAVCDNAHEELPAPRGSGTDSAPDLSPHRLHWAVPDPTPADTDAAFEAAYQQIVHRVDRLAEAFTHPATRTRRRAPAQRPATT